MLVCVCVCVCVCVSESVRETVYRNECICAQVFMMSLSEMEYKFDSKLKYRNRFQLFTDGLSDQLSNLTSDLSLMLLHSFTIGTQNKHQPPAKCW